MLYCRLMAYVLVTGANGFVGQALCGALSKTGYKVRAAVRKEDRLKNRSFEGEVSTVGDIGPDISWTPALEDVDTVVHLAGRVHVLRETHGDPHGEFRSVNVHGAEYLARMAVGAGVRRLIYVSSVGVNGKVTYGKAFTEEQAPSPHNAYASSKEEAEKVLHRVAKESGLEVVILRPPLIYGPGVKANFLRLMNLVDQGLPLPLASVRNRRSLLYVGNLADATISCIRHPQASGKTFLVSDGEDVSTPELIRRIAYPLKRPARLLPFPPSLLLVAARLAGKRSVMEPLLESLVVDSSKIRHHLGWRPPYTMMEGLEETANWFRSRK